MIRLTIAQYYTPTGRAIQKPYQDGWEDYMKDINNRWTHGEFIYKDSIEFPDSLKYQTKVFKKIVYGGGGIMPDDFIPIDTTLRSQYHQMLLRKGVLFSFISKYVDTNRAILNQEYPDFDKFNKNFKINDDILSELDKMAVDEKIFKDSLDTITELNINYLHNHIKALLAGDLWDKNEFWKVFNDYNPNYKRAFEIITDDQKYNNLIKGLE
jgi:carboxyl-terminal processing protease